MTNSYKKVKSCCCGGVLPRGRGSHYGHGRMVWMNAVAVIVFLLLTGPVSAQFMVQPSFLEFTPTAGEVVRETVTLQNFENRKVSVDLVLFELSQQEGGDWKVLDPNSGEAMPKLSSCSKWIGRIPEAVAVPPFASVPIPLTIRVPRGARGYYGAALLATLNAPADTVGVALTYRFVAPIVIEIQGRPMTHKIELTDIGMELARPEEEGIALVTTLATIGVENRGGTLCRLSAFVRVRGLVEGRWRDITIAEFRDRYIIPGVTLKLTSNIGRSLPSGKYKLEGVLYVDGRRIKTLGKEIDFVGETSVTKFASDAPLFLDPAEVYIDSLPGATRTGVIRINNASEEPVKVQAMMLTPPVFRGVALGDLEATEYSCADWVRAEPNEFTIGADSQQVIRFTANMSADKLFPCYYGLLYLQAAYLDGQNAGTKSAYVGVTNKSREVTFAVQPMKLTLGFQGESKYIVVARFWNVGNLHITPVCTGTVATPEGITRTRISLQGRGGLLLPLELRDFSGVIDFSRLSAGVYRLTAFMDYGLKQSVTTQIPIQVSVEGNRRVVEIIGPEQFEKTIGVKWQK